MLFCNRLPASLFKLGKPDEWRLPNSNAAHCPKQEDNI